MKTNTRGKRDLKVLEKRRMKAANWLNEGKSQAEVARRLHVSRQSVSRWYGTWKAAGQDGLRTTGRAGRKPRLNRCQLKEVERELLRGPQAHGYTTQLWTLPRIAKVIERTCGVQYHPGHVWRILRDLGWSCQKPSRKAKERNEIAIRRWIRKDWPRIKKKPVGSRPCSSSSTNPVSPRNRASTGLGPREERRRS